MIIEKELLMNVFELSGKNIFSSAAELRVSVQTVMASLCKHKIKYDKPKSIYFGIKNTNPSQFQKSLLIGSILGSGYLVKHSKSNKTVFTQRIDIKQAEWLKWKHSNLMPFTDSNTLVREEGSISLSTIPHMYLTDLYENFYCGGIKKSSKSFIENNIDSLSLSILLCDCNTYIGGNYTLNIPYMSKDDVRYILDYSNSLFDSDSVCRLKKVLPRCVHYKIPQFSTNTKRPLILE